MFLSFYLAASPINASQLAADAVAAQWETAWTSFMTGPIYTAINYSMLGLAMLFFVISASFTLYEWIKSSDDANFLRLIAPFIVLLFLMNNGQLALTSVGAIRGIGNYITTNIVNNAIGGATLTARFDGQIIEQESLNRIKTQMSKCTNEAEGSPKQAACLDQLEVIIKDEQTKGNITDPDILSRLGTFLGNWASAKATAISNGAAMGNAVGNVPGAALGAIVGGATSLIGDAYNTLIGAALDPLTGIIAFILLAITAAVQHMTEASLLLTGLITPIFITSALLPSGSKSIVTLLTAFWSIINFKICYTIIVILTNTLITGSDRTQLITLGLCTAIFSPVLAGILASGSGMAFFKAASSAAGQVAGFAGNAAMAAATGGLSTAAQSVAKIATNFIK